MYLCILYFPFPTGLRNLIVDHLEVMEAGDARVAISAFFKNTLSHIDHMKSLPGIGEKLVALDA